MPSGQALPVHLRRRLTDMERLLNSAFQRLHDSFGLFGKAAQRACMLHTNVSYVSHVEDDQLS